MVVGMLAFIGVFLSTYLTLYKLGYIGELQCAVGSCETVNTSRWATFFGVPVAAWGLGFYVATLALVMLGIQERYADSRGVSIALVTMTGWGVVFSTCRSRRSRTARGRSARRRTPRPSR